MDCSPPLEGVRMTRLPFPGFCRQRQLCPSWTWLPSGYCHARYLTIWLVAGDKDVGHLLYLSFPIFSPEKSIDVLPPARAHNSAPRPRAFARGSCIFFPAEKSAPL